MLLAIDTAHAHTKSVINILREIKRNFPGAEVIAGNIGTQMQLKSLSMKVRMLLK